MSHSDSEIRDDTKIRTIVRPNFKAKFGQTNFRSRRKRHLEIFGRQIQLISAVNTNNVDKVETLLKIGANPNSADLEHRSALHIAVSRGYKDVVKLLLEYGADPNQRDIIQNTPLHLAACVHNLSIVTMLINAKADVGCLDLHGRNPFQLASSKLQILQRSWKDGTIEMVRLKQQLEDVVDLLLSVLMRDVEQKMERLNRSDVDDLQLMKLSLNSDSPEELDNQMCRLLAGIEKFKITDFT